MSSIDHKISTLGHNTPPSIAGNRNSVFKSQISELPSILAPKLDHEN